LLSKQGVKQIFCLRAVKGMTLAAASNALFQAAAKEADKALCSPHCC
jgi:hypothetical protein